MRQAFAGRQAFAEANFCGEFALLGHFQAMAVANHSKQACF
jgi:hypothetical protein